MATPRAYRFLAARLAPHRRAIFTVGAAYLVLWLAYALASMITQKSLPWYIHNTR